MKPTSIVFLVIALLLLIGGIVTCSIAKDIAVTDGYELFHTDEDGENRFTESIPETLHKIDLVFTDAEIHIYGGADTEFVEFLNFRDGLYTVTATNSVLSFDEIPNVKSLLSGSSNFSFSGIRHFFTNATTSSGEKQINIYLKDQSSLKSISLSGKNCSLQIHKLKTKCDISVKAETSATVQSDFLRTACTFSLETPKLTLDLNGVSLHSLQIQTEHAEISSQSTFFDQLSILTETGTIDIGSSVSLAIYGYQITGNAKTFTWQNTALPLPYTAEKPREKSGTVEIQLGDAQLSLHGTSEN